MGSVRWKPEKLQGKAHRMALPHKCSFASSDVSFRALSGASSDASEEVFVSRPRRLQNKGNGRVTLMSSAEGDEFLIKVAWGRFIVNADTMSVLW